MNAKDSLRQQFGLIYGTIERNTEGMSQEDSLRQPAVGGNCANWILGHVAQVHNNAMQLLGESPVLAAETLAAKLRGPITSADGALDWQQLRSEFLGSRDRCLSALGAIDEDRLDQGGYPHPFGGEATLGDLLTILAFHQAYHAGQLGLSRRIAGHAGAIAGPGERVKAATA